MALNRQQSTGKRPGIRKRWHREPEFLAQRSSIGVLRSCGANSGITCLTWESQTPNLQADQVAIRISKNTLHHVLQSVLINLSSISFLFLLVLLMIVYSRVFANSKGFTIYSIFSYIDQFFFANLHSIPLLELLDISQLLPEIFLSFLL